jgi:hypothetical protein
MVTITALWLPILLSAVFVFIVSSIIHMVLQYHQSDFDKLPGEDGIAEAFRKAGVGPGNYHIPHCAKMSDMNSEATQEKFKQGPVGFIMLLPNGPPAMGKALVGWFVFTLFVGVVVAYVITRTLDASTDYLTVFRVAGTVAFLTYAGSEPVRSIWGGVRWSNTVKNMVDGLIYALVTAGTFGWLWA